MAQCELEFAEKELNRVQIQITKFFRDVGLVFNNAGWLVEYLLGGVEVGDDPVQGGSFVEMACDGYFWI